MGSGGHLMRFVLYEAPLGPYGRPSPFGTGVCAGIWGLTELAAMLLIVVLGSSLLIELGSRDVFLAEALKDITGSSRRKVKSAVTSLTRAILPTAVGVLLFLLVLCQLPVRCISNETYQLRVGMFTSATIDAVFFALVAFVLFVTAGVLRRIQER